MEEGRKAVQIARRVIEEHVRREKPSKHIFPPKFDEKSGIFVTIEKFPSGDLRGCIGYPYPYFPLKEALQKAAVEATSDPRFPILDESELDAVTVEVSLLTPPEEIIVKKPKEYKDKVIIGRDGLIVARGLARGLLLPQVPVEWEWDVEEFLANTCMKAGLMPDAWLDGETRISKFQAEIFGEKEPHGEVVRRVLGGENEGH